MRVIRWTIYEARFKQFIRLTHAEFRDFLDSKLVKFKGCFITTTNKEKK